ncbi:hypothetical protein TRFO_13394 [Tritrichomonas foetus]|uniref:Uncharacterized protein n=1 Tax=Tritrichomonas foetus TaxID=1144522 RepID=A0A1J4KYA7_9EUKA|nr:hypothetical protein TRFO_13394 [Tritrichomonas foetus]|eukprot:OHT16223.1 hypothetical protein TRFO_13394 [Tritrichomonas foetus]
MGRNSNRQLPEDFSLWCNEKNHKFKADTFAKVSKKCAALVKAMDYQGTINHPVSEETFTAFANACQLRPFKVTLTNAFELLELAEEWGIPSLETFVNNYIKQKGLRVIDENDYLGSLITKYSLPEGQDYSQEIAGIARTFNEYLRDERLSQVHPEHLFKILMQAEHRKINQNLLIDFVMKLFEKEPEKAVPLCLRIDFDRLTNEQVESIFQTREIHEQAMGYFIAEAMSLVRDKQQEDLAKTEQNYIKEIQEIREYIVKHRAVALAKVHDEFEAEVAKLNEVIEKQQNIIDDLTEIRNNQRDEFDQIQNNFIDTTKKFEREIERITEITDRRMANDEERRAKIRAIIDENIQPVTEMLEDRLAEISGNDKHRRNLMEKGARERRDMFLQFHDDQRAALNRITNEISHIHEQINETRATMAAKIISDQLRPDGFLRNIERRFLSIVKNDNENLWDLDCEKVKNADALLKKLESSVSQSCPIKVHLALKQSTDAIQRLADLFTGNSQNKTVMQSNEQQQINPQ